MKNSIIPLVLILVVSLVGQSQDLPFESKTLACREKLNEEETLPGIVYQLKCDFFPLAQSINLKGCALLDVHAKETIDLKLEHQNYYLGFLSNDDLKLEVNVSKKGNWGSIKFPNERFFECLEK